MQVKAFSEKLKKEIRSRGFGLLSRGVRAFTHTVEDWAERQVQ